jgi:RNA polymerase sigma-70 factor, ECF subfamily
MILLIFLTDEEFARLVKGDPGIIERLYEEFQKSIMTYFVIKTFGNRAVSEDLVHETFCSIMESVHRLRHGEKLELWIFTIAKRTLIKYQRKLFRQRKYMKIVKEEAETPPDVIESIEKKQRLLLFTMAVETLHPDYKRVFNLRFDSCNSVKEIASIIGKTEKSVENLLRRIKEKLKESMLSMGATFFSGEGGER